MTAEGLITTDKMNCAPGFAFLVFLLTAAHLFPQSATEKSSNVILTVLDEVQAPVNDCMVDIVHWDTDKEHQPVQRPNGRYETSQRGIVMLSLEPGSYDVSVSCMGLLPAARRIRVRKNKVLKLNIKLKLDPQQESAGS